MNSPGPFVTACAAFKKQVFPGMSEKACLALARGAYTDTDGLARPTLDPEASAILETYSGGPNCARVDVLSQSGQNELLAFALEARGGSMPFGNNHIIRKAIACEEAGLVKVDLIANLGVPRGGVTTFGSSYTEFVAGKRRSPYVNPTVLGKLLRKVAYPVNNKKRSFSYLLKCLGPKPN